MRLVLASNNAKKLAELRELLAPLGLEIVAQGSLGIAEADEPHATFVENALAKARHAARAAAGAAIADDSGLVVDVLGGAPGVRSARYAALHGGATGDAENNRVLLERMHGVADRRARFVAVLVALRSADDTEPLVATGRWEGEILHAPRGTGGFGYDPLMFIPALGRSVAELAQTEKNALSHRAIAAARMRDAMRQAWTL
jgi:XTP/dITP diphosphohydrolase